MPKNALQKVEALCLTWIIGFTMWCIVCVTVGFGLALGRLVYRGLTGD